jgi:hypothetical protein
MLGFLIGIGSLIGLIAVLRAGRRGACGGGGCGSRWGGGGWHGRHHHWHGHHGHGGEQGWRGGSSRGWLRFLFERLDTSPGQEKEIAAAVDEMIAKGRELQGEGKASRNDVAKVLRGEFDENALGELFARHDDRLRELQKAFAGALGRIHTALEPEQRAKLAELIESNPRGFGFGGPYRGWV